MATGQRETLNRDYFGRAAKRIEVSIPALWQGRNINPTLLSQKLREGCFLFSRV